ncbi:MAG: alpha/beta-hydrolase [Rubritepida sp.]|nr:alpha/beta-hydrolase [Rubritepida sp.]
MSRLQRLLGGTALILGALAGAAAHAQTAPAPPAALPADIAAQDQSGIGRRGFFYVGGQYAGEGAAQLMRGQIYVEVVVPREVRQPYPLVLIHGAAQTATNWMGTPDGRQGWADYFAGQGYIVYMIDQPSRGRSSSDVGRDGRQINWAAGAIEDLFTSPERAMRWPQASLHTQWPGTGRRGDPVFDRFYATQVEGLASNEDSERLMQIAGAALLDRIGPAILMTHSQAGPFGWLIADARPRLVKGIMALEPSGPPFWDAVLGDGPNRRWGLTNPPMTYDPPVTDPAQLQVAQEATADGPNLERCRLQTGTPHQLPNLRGIPIAIVVAEASYHSVYDHCTSKYLRQAGVENDFLRLADQGIRGNGHMIMIERNSLEIAQFLDRWMREHIR